MYVPLTPMAYYQHAISNHADARSRFDLMSVKDFTWITSGSPSLRGAKTTSCQNTTKQYVFLFQWLLPSGARVKASKEPLGPSTFLEASGAKLAFGLPVVVR